MMERVEYWKSHGGELVFVVYSSSEDGTEKFECRHPSEAVFTMYQPPLAELQVARDLLRLQREPENRRLRHVVLWADSARIDWGASPQREYPHITENRDD